MCGHAFSVSDIPHIFNVIFKLGVCSINDKHEPIRLYEEQTLFTYDVNKYKSFIWNASGFFKQIYQLIT